MDPSSGTGESVITGDCSICLMGIIPQPQCEEEKGTMLDCSHIFHRECIGEWLKQKHSCPLCRAPVRNISTAEVSLAPQMTLNDILVVPDIQPAFGHEHPAFSAENIAEILYFVRNTIRAARQVRQLSLNENSQVAATARRVNNIAGSIFGFGF